MTERTTPPATIAWPVWFDGAPCAGQTALFFPEDPMATGPAKRVCHSCPVLAECRAWGLAHVGRQWDGIYGGMTLGERRMEARFGVPKRERCVNDHPYAGNEVWDPSGRRRCGICKQETSRRSDARARLRRAS